MKQGKWAEENERWKKRMRFKSDQEKRAKRARDLVEEHVGLKVKQGSRGLKSETGEADRRE